MKRTWQCTKCQSLNVGYIERLIDHSSSGHLERQLGMLEVDEGGWLGKGYVPTGEIEAFVCTDCGYFEEYVKQPETIDWDKMDGWRWCRPERRQR